MKEKINILVLPIDGMEHLTDLLNSITDPVTRMGKQVENGWIIRGHAIIQPNGSREYEHYNMLLQETINRGCTDLYITKT
jgi:hypothetical protein